jgi:hypothetical protein
MSVKDSNDHPQHGDNKSANQTVEHKESPSLPEK